MQQATPAAKQYRLSVDDNIQFMEDLHLNREKYRTIFENAYLRGFQKMHERYGVKVHFNMFYSYFPGSFSLSDMTDGYKAEFEANADWMKFSFHAKYNDPPSPYINSSPEELLSDYSLVMRELERIVGKKSLSHFTTLHYVAATKPACLCLRKNGVIGLTGMFTRAGTNTELSYYLTIDQLEHLRAASFWKEEDTGLVFIRNDLVINNFPREELPAKLRGVRKAHPEASYMDVMIHEQYFYADYSAYQPDFFGKLTDVASWMQAHGYSPVLLDEAL